MLIYVTAECKHNEPGSRLYKGLFMLLQRPESECKPNFCPLRLLYSTSTQGFIVSQQQVLQRP